MLREFEVQRVLAGVKLAYELDPLSPVINLARSLSAHMAGQYEQEAEIARNFDPLRADPRFADLLRRVGLSD